MTESSKSRGSNAGFEAARLRLARKLWRSAERQADAIRKRLTRDQPAPEAERDVKILAVLARTLRDLSATTIDRAGGEDGGAHDDVPDHSDDLRQALSKRLSDLMDRQRTARE